MVFFGVAIPIAMSPIFAEYPLWSGFAWGLTAAVLATAVVNALLNLAAWARRKLKPVRTDAIVLHPFDDGRPISAAADRVSGLRKLIGGRRT